MTYPAILTTICILAFILFGQPFYALGAMLGTFWLVKLAKEAN